MDEQDQRASRNASQLQYAAQAMNQLRPDGDMLASTQHLLSQILDTERQLRQELESTKQQLHAEREVRMHLESIVRQVADVVVNGHRAKGT